MVLPWFSRRKSPCVPEHGHDEHRDKSRRGKRAAEIKEPDSMRTD